MGSGQSVISNCDNNLEFPGTGGEPVFFLGFPESLLPGSTRALNQNNFFCRGMAGPAQKLEGTPAVPLRENNNQMNIFSVGTNLEFAQQRLGLAVIHGVPRLSF